MRKREFVGVSTAIGVICTIIWWIAYCKGKSIGFMKGYMEADKQRDFENTQLV